MWWRSLRTVYSIELRKDKGGCEVQIQ